MSKSLGNAIYLSDSKEIIKEKVMQMYTDPNHIRVEDPGSVAGNVVFSYLDIFDPNQNEVAELKAQYEKGGLGDVKIKQRLIEVLETIIAPIRTRREELAKDPERVMQILRDGTRKAQEIGEETMRQVREAIKINYF
jgi:tryptophanyl-tRNA synthetase